jgi:hypothetical protein
MGCTSSSKKFDISVHYTYVDSTENTKNYLVTVERGWTIAQVKGEIAKISGGQIGTAIRLKYQDKICPPNSTVAQVGFKKGCDVYAEMDMG